MLIKVDEGVPNSGVLGLAGLAPRDVDTPAVGTPSKLLMRAWDIVNNPRYVFLIVGAKSGHHCRP